MSGKIGGGGGGGLAGRRGLSVNTKKKSSFGGKTVMSEQFSPLVMMNSPKSGRGRRARGVGMTSPVHQLPTIGNNGRSPKHRGWPPPSF